MTSCKHSNRQEVSAYYAHADTVCVTGVPAILRANDYIYHGGEGTVSERSYHIVKMVGDGSFGTVWFAEWHGPLRRDNAATKVSVQCSSMGQKLVALKKMKKIWEAGWHQCRALRELESLRAIHEHRNVVFLEDFFLVPSSSELYFVFEPMEGNLYQLMRSRRGRPFAGGLLSSIFHQVLSGLHHIHVSGYFHRDLKPENLLVSTTGLHDYRSTAVNVHDRGERDVVVVLKIADLGLARSADSPLPYTEYVSTRWYRAPEVLLRSFEYSAAVDMWALGTILAELINLRPLFPGHCEVDQMSKICNVLGEPTDRHGSDDQGKFLGGGPWEAGIQRSALVGFDFPQLKPMSFQDILHHNANPWLTDCIADLLRYDPDLRPNSTECLMHDYTLEALHSNRMMPNLSYMHVNSSPGLLQAELLGAFHRRCKLGGTVNPHTSTSLEHHYLPSQLLDLAISSMRTAASNAIKVRYVLPWSLAHPSANDLSVESVESSDRVTKVSSSEHFFFSKQYAHIKRSILPVQHARLWSQCIRKLEVSSHADAMRSPHTVHYSRASPQSFLPEQSLDVSRYHSPHLDATPNDLSMPAALNMRKRRSKWPLASVFSRIDATSSQNNLATQRDSASTRGKPALTYKSLTTTPHQPSELKQRRKEAERLSLEAEKARRVLVAKRSRDQARAVMEKRTQALKSHQGTDIDWDMSLPSGRPAPLPMQAAAELLDMRRDPLICVAERSSAEFSTIDYKIATERTRREYAVTAHEEDADIVSGISFVTVASD